MRRIDAIKAIMTYVLDDEIIVSSCGIISREVYLIKDRPLNFYVMGSMGAALGIGIGLALHTDKTVTVIAGDGEILMSLGTLVLMNKLNLSNLKLIILDNNSYQSTGGQKSCSDAINFRKLCWCEVYHVETTGYNAPRIPIPHSEIKRRFRNAINSL